MILPISVSEKNDKELISYVKGKPNYSNFLKQLIYVTMFEEGVISKEDLLEKLFSTKKYNFFNYSGFSLEQPQTNINSKIDKMMNSNNEITVSSAQEIKEKEEEIPIEQKEDTKSISDDEPIKEIPQEAYTEFNNLIQMFGIKNSK